MKLNTSVLKKTPTMKPITHHTTPVVPKESLRSCTERSIFVTFILDKSLNFNKSRLIYRPCRTQFA